jgi:hypothetical protein
MWRVGEWTKGKGKAFAASAGNRWKSSVALETGPHSQHVTKLQDYYREKLMTRTFEGKTMRREIRIVARLVNILGKP